MPLKRIVLVGLLGLVVYFVADRVMESKDMVIKADVNPLMYVMNKSKNVQIEKRFTAKSLSSSIMGIDESIQNKKQKKPSIEILKNQYQSLKEIFNKTNNPDIKDSFGTPIVFYAVMFSDISTLKELLLLDVQIEKELGANILLMAIANNSVMSRQRNDKEKILWEQNNVDILKLLAQSNKFNFGDDAFSSTPMLKSFTPLSMASRFNNIDAIKIILDEGINIDIQTSEGKTALMQALESNNIESVSYLIENGASKEMVDYNEKRVTHYAYSSGNLELIKKLDPNKEDILRTSSDGTTSLMMASQKGNAKTLQYFIDSGVDVDASNIEGYTALLEASKTGNVEAIRLLIDNNADVTAKAGDAEWDLPSLAIVGDVENRTRGKLPPKNSYETLEYIYSLEEYKGKIDEVYDGDNLLSLSIMSGNVGGVKFALDNGARLDIDTDYGSILEVSDKYGSQEIQQLINQYKNQ